MEIVDLGDGNKKSRFSRTTHNSSTFLLNILSVEPEDSGRYYCAEHSASYLAFYDKGVILYVGDVWTNRSEIMILTQWWDDQTGNLTVDGNSEGEGPAELLCVVTGLNAPWIPVTWKSSFDRRRNPTNQTWSTKLSRDEYCVISQLQLLEDLDRDELEEWWCEVQVGKNHFHRSSSFQWRKEEQGWNGVVLYTVIVVCILCVCLLSILCYYRHHRLRGSPPRAAGVSPLPESQGDVTTGVTYAHLDFKGPKDKRKRIKRKADNHTDRMVYSEVRYKSES
ncbi:uncharacterized protein LOC108925002 isoform X2 [Scleropages formosus]|nr:uncharacterized protein LOC108925002 isoform X2 [Scleropages formosus]XP_018592232.1 uncharacterized protein LOC108925002 isoform X2 [Scleropages formosus]